MVANLARVLLSFAFLFSLCAPIHADQYDDRATAEEVARRLQQVDEAKMDAARKRLHAGPPLTAKERDAKIDEHNNNLNRIFFPIIGVLLVLLVIICVQRHKAKQAEAVREQMEARRKMGKDW